MFGIDERIKSRRILLGFTQGELGKKVGVSDVTVSKWESGLNKPKARLIIA